MSEAIVFTSGKGGVGKTTVISNIGVELSQLDKKVIMLDTDMGLRNLDLVMGIEDKVNYNILDILNRSCRILRRPASPAWAYTHTPARRSETRRAI